MIVPPPLPVTAEQVALLVHDLRNPLAGVTAALQLLGMGLAPSEQEEIRAEATWAANRLGRMITDLLLLHAATRGEPTAEAGIVALVPALDEAARQATLCGRLDGIRLAVSCAEGAEGARLAGDAALLQLLLDHLLVAVVRQAPPGALVPVRITQDAEGPVVTVAIPPGEGAAAWQDALGASPSATPTTLREEAAASAWADRGWRGDLASAVLLMRLLAPRLGGVVTAGCDAAGGVVVTLGVPTLPPNALPG
jgi:hypothetical protein